MTRINILTLIICAALASPLSVLAQTASDTQDDSVVETQELSSSESSEGQDAAKVNEEGESEDKAEVETDQQDRPRDIFDDIDDDVRSGNFEQSCSIPVG